MNRRELLATLIGAATLDPERLLWVPGRKAISIPKPPMKTWRFALVSYPHYDPNCYSLQGSFLTTTAIDIGAASFEDAAAMVSRMYSGKLAEHEHIYGLRPDAFFFQPKTFLPWAKDPTRYGS